MELLYTYGSVVEDICMLFVGVSALDEE